MEEKEFASRIRELRTLNGVTAREMSLSLGQYDGYINAVENGRIMPSMRSFFNICDYLGITPKDFFDVDEVDPKTTTLLVKRAKYLGRDQAIHILAIINALTGFDQE